MTVKELIRSLKDMNEEDEVVFSYDYGDHWNTQVAEGIKCVEEGDVVRSEYHQMDKVVEDGDGDGARRVVILS